jgi:hypothetical protein
VFVVREPERGLVLQHRLLAMEASDGARMRKRLAMIAELDTLATAREQGFRSTQHWLTVELGLEPRTARDYVQVAQRLEVWTEVRDALGEGRLSYSKCRALSRASLQENETELLEVALSSTVVALETHVRQLRSAPSADLETAEHARRQRSLHFGSWTATGMRPFWGLLDPVTATLLEQAVEGTAAQIHGAPGEPRPAPAARRADALAQLIGGTAPQTTLVLHADLAALAHDNRGDVLYLQHGPAIPSELARRLTCEAMVTLEGLNHGRAHRLITPAQRKALTARDGPECFMPGCHCAHGLDGHHIRHWSRGGRSDLENLILLCPFHHRLFHDGGWQMSRRRDHIIIRNPAGQITDEIDRPTPTPRKSNRRRGDCPTWTIVTDWQTEATSQQQLRRGSA